MRVLFDQGTPVPLRRFLGSHTVMTVYEKGWSGTGNGDLLRLADQQMFEVFLTTDQHLKYQQNLTNRQIAIVVLPTTSWPVIQKHTAKIAKVLDSLAPGDFIELISDFRIFGSVSASAAHQDLIQAPIGISRYASPCLKRCLKILKAVRGSTISFAGFREL